MASDDTKKSQKDLQNDSNLPLEKLSRGQKRKLLVLCLGGLLVNRVHIDDWQLVRGLRPDLHDGIFRVFKRPFATEFVKFCLERFEVGIWSATTERNTEAALECVTGPEMKEKLAFVWGQEECIDAGIGCLGNRQKPLFLKDLKLLWEKKYLDLPWRRGQFAPSNTLLVCVDPPTSMLNPPHTAIFPPPYRRHNITDTFLGLDGELRRFLEGLADANNVPDYVREHSFGQRAITPLHPDWYHYANVVRELGKEEDKCTNSTSSRSITRFPSPHGLPNLHCHPFLPPEMPTRRRNFGHSFHTQDEYSRSGDAAFPLPARQPNFQETRRQRWHPFLPPEMPTWRRNFGPFFSHTRDEYSRSDATVGVHHRSRHPLLPLETPPWRRNLGHSYRTQDEYIRSDDAVEVHHRSRHPLLPLERLTWTRNLGHSYHTQDEYFRREREGREVGCCSFSSPVRRARSERRERARDRREGERHRQKQEDRERERDSR